MKDPKRIDRIITLLKKAWKKHPNKYCRFGQFLENEIFRHPLNSDGCIFYVEDEDIERRLNEILKKPVE